MVRDRRSRSELLGEIEQLRRRLGEVGAGVEASFHPAGDRQATNEADQQYRALVESMNEGAAILESDNTVAYCNPRLADMLGLPPEQIVGKSFNVHVASASSAAFAEMTCAVECCKEEVTLMTESGTLLPTLLSCCPSDLDGVRRISLVVTDLSEQKRADELTAAQRLARSILTQAGEAIVVCDTTGRIIRASRVAVELCGKNPRRRHLDDVLPLRLPGENGLFSISHAVRGERYENVEVSFNRSDGRTFHLVLNARTLVGGGGAILGCIVTLTDVTARRQAEEDLRRSEERFRLIADTLPAMVWTADPDGRVDYVNRRFLEYSGVPPEPGKEGYFIPLHPDDREATTRVWEEALRTGGPYQMEHRLRRFDGAYRWYLCRSAPVRDEDGRITKWYGTSIDIHDLREAREQLRESETKLQLAVRTTGIGTYDYYPLTGQFVWSDLARQHFGLSPEEPVDYGMFLTGVHCEDRERVDQLMKEALTGENGGEYRAEYRTIGLRDGNERWLAARGKTLFDESGQAVRFVATTLDITERKRVERELRLATEELERRVAERTAELTAMVATLQEEVIDRIGAEKSLRESEALLKTVLDTLPVAVWVLDERGSVVTMNPAATGIWGEEQRAGGKASAAYPGWRHGTGDLLARHDWGGQRAIRTGETTLGEVLDIEAFNGTRKVIAYSAVPLRNDAGDIIGAVVVVEDITQRIRSEQALQAEVAERLRAMEELRRKDHLLMQQSRLAAMGEMIGNIAHQWRQPLNTLGLIIQGLALHQEIGTITKEELDGRSPVPWRHPG